MDFILVIYLLSLFCANAEGLENSETFNEGDEKEIQLEYETEKLKLGSICTDWCEVNNFNLTALKSCYPYENRIRVIFHSLIVSKELEGHWSCYVQGKLPTRNFTVTVTKTGTTGTTSKSQLEPIPPPNHMWWYIGGSIGVLVILIIIAQTACVLYFRSKARQAEINKNLTPKNNNAQQLAARYEVRPKSKKNSIDEVRESVIYEALDPIKDRPPSPPPIETLPGTPKALTRFNSESDLPRKPYESQTAPWPRPKLTSSKFNTVDGNSSLKRIINRPRLPLPDPEEEYEIMERDGHPVPKPTTHTNNTFEMSQRLVISKSKKFFGETPPMERRPMNMNPRLYGPDINSSPIIIRKQTHNKQNTNSPGQNMAFGSHIPAGQKRPPTMPKPGFSGQNAPTGPRAPNAGPNTQFERQNVLTEQNTNEQRFPWTGQNRPHMEQNEPLTGANWRPGASSQRPNLEAVPVLPRMISPVNLKSVKHLKNPPAESIEVSRMMPAQSLTNLASKRPPAPPNKPKPPMPIPIPVQAIGPSDDDTYDPRATWGDEWTYEALPAYNIYGNVPPVKRDD